MRRVCTGTLVYCEQTVRLSRQGGECRALTGDTWLGGCPSSSEVLAAVHRCTMSKQSGSEVLAAVHRCTMSKQSGSEVLAAVHRCTMSKQSGSEGGTPTRTTHEAAAARKVHRYTMSNQ